MESNETPTNNGLDVSKVPGEERILVVNCDPAKTSVNIADKSDAISASKVQPIRILIPQKSPGAPLTTTTAATTTPPKIIISPMQLSTQPTVSVKLGTNQLNVKMVTNASLIQNSLTSPPTAAVVNGIVTDSTDHPSPSEPNRDDSPATKMTREQKQLQDSINSSMVLSQMMIGSNTARKSRVRKKKSQSPKEKQIGQEQSFRSKSMEVLEKELEARRSRESSPMSQNSENDQVSKRQNMRSSNADFAQKRKSFMKEIIKTQESADEAEISDDDSRVLSRSSSNRSITGTLPQAPKKGWTRYCWRCYQSGELLSCTHLNCKRSFHLRCLSKQQQPLNPTDKWSCPECYEIEQAETLYKGKPKFDKDFVSTLLTFVFNRMSQTKNSYLLTSTTEDPTVPNYEDIIVYPMNLDILQKNINTKKYKSIEAFHSDAKWLLYNCSVLQDKRRYLPNAKGLLKVCRQEILEIETCFECYFKANKNADWFTDVCSSPHILLWAKLRGFPYWPAKSMSVNATTGQVNVRFFGAHDRAWINVKDCYLYSKEDPNGTNPKKQNDIAECIKEVNNHIEKLSEIFNGFKHAPLRTPYDPTREQEQLKQLLPNIDRYHRTTEISKLVEALISGHKPKLTLKIIRTSDNTLATSSLETNGEKMQMDTKDEPGITKFKILNSNKKNCQILPVAEPGKFTMKRSADSWMIQDSRAKKLKSTTEESEQEKQKGTLMKSLNLERTDVVKEGTPSTGDGFSESGLSGRKSEVRKRRKTIHAENDTLDDNDKESPVQEKRRSQRIKSTVEKALEAQNLKETNPVKENAVESVPAVVANQTSPLKTAMTEPPPLVPFDSSIQIKPDPDSEEDPKTQTAQQTVVPKPRVVPIIPQKPSPPVRQERIKVKNISKLTDPTQGLRKLLPASLVNSNKPVVPSSQSNGPKRSLLQQQQQARPIVPKPTQNMVYIPMIERNGPINDASAHNQSGASSSSTSNDSEQPIHALSGLITPNFAAAITDTIVRAPPKLTASPNGTRSALRGEPNNLFNSEAGPTSRLLNDNAHRLADFFRSVITDSMSDLAASGSIEAKYRKLEMEMEQLKQKHAKEMAELKHNSDLILSEFKNSQEKREAQLIEEITRKCEIERIRAVEKAIEETKNKNWCTFCKREAIYHCCSNTWYCGHRCQQKDWGDHMRQCQNGSKEDSATPEQKRSQHFPGASITSVPTVQQQQQQHRHVIVQQNPKGPPIGAPLVRQQQQQQSMLMQKPSHMGVISQRAATGPQIISVRGMVK